MRTIFTLLLSIYFSTSFANNSRLSVTFAKKTNVKVVIDGYPYQLQDNSVIVENLQPGFHTVEIYKQRKGGNGGIVPNGKKGLVYSSSINIRPSYHVDIMISRFGKIFVDERQMNNSNWEETDDYYEPDYSNYKKPMASESFSLLKSSLIAEKFSSTRINVFKQAANNNYFSSAQVRELMQTFSYDGDKVDVARLAYDRTIDKPNYFIVYDVINSKLMRDELAKYISNRSAADGDSYPVKPIMNNDNFYKVKETLKAITSNTSKIITAKQIITDNYFSADQVKELLPLFSFDDSKLEIAKFAYPKTVDKNNYFILYDAFAFQSYKDQLANYIANY